MSKIYLAIHEDAAPYIESSPAAVAHALANEFPIAYYVIDVDPDTGEPSLSERVTLSDGPRTVVTRTEEVKLRVGQRDVDTAEVTVSE